MELEKQIDELKVSTKTLLVSFVLMIPCIFFDAWILQIAWDKWLMGLTGVSLTYISYVGAMMFLKVIVASLTYVKRDDKIKTAKDSIVESVGRRLGVLIIYGLFSLIWMILI